MMTIGLMGKKRSGKDTFASTLVEDHGFVRVAFADLMKDALLHFNPIVAFNGYTIVDFVDSLGWERAKDRPQVRRALQDFGSSMRETLGEDVWVAPIRRRINELHRAGHDVVITDVRYANEAQMVRDFGGVLVHIIRPSLSADGDTHITETGIPTRMAHTTIINDGTFEKLAFYADRLVS